MPHRQERFSLGIVFPRLAGGVLTAVETVDFVKGVTTALRGALSLRVVTEIGVAGTLGVPASFGVAAVLGAVAV